MPSAQQNRLEVTRKGWGVRGLILLTGLAILVWIPGVMLGTSAIDFARIFESDSIDYRIFWHLRVSRVCIAFLAGSGLAVCGMVFQALFLNTLATPFTLGVAGGASCGAAFAIFLSGLGGEASGPGITLGALGGAALATFLVAAFSHTRMGHQRHIMLLAGVAVSFFFSSLLLLIQALSSFYQSFHIVRWLMGGIAVAGYREVVLLSLILLPCYLVILRLSSRLNMLLLGDDLAVSRGLDVARTRRILFLVVSVMVAAIVSVVGPIGFVGLVIPHICRILWGGDHRMLAPATLLLGGAMLVLCDTVARLILSPSGLPVGVVTSLLGAPFFFVLLMRNQYRF